MKQTKKQPLLPLLLGIAFLALIIIAKPSNPIYASETVTINRTKIDLYALSEKYQSRLSIPSDLPQSYQLKVSNTSEKVTYSILEGDSVTISSSGKITPATSVYYWNGNIGSSFPTGAAGETKEITYNFGTSKIKVTAGSKTFTVTVTVHAYETYYAEQIMDAYLRTNIKDSMSDIEKLELITKFPAMYDYNEHYSSYTGMIVWGGGDCWASSNAILYLCEKIGLKAHIRYAANDPGASFGHRNVAVQIGTDIYVAEAGYAETAPRSYKVTKENQGFYCQRSKSGTLTLIQYDGFLDTITVPDSIDGTPVTAIGEQAFFFGCAYSGVQLKKVILPDSITKIGDYAFTKCRELQTIQVEETNPNYRSVDGILYDKDMTTLLAYPAGRAGELTVPDGVEEIGAYAVYFTFDTDTIYLPKSVKTIRDAAFGDSQIKKIYFAGDMPAIDETAFSYLNLQAYYPKGNATWKNIQTQTYSAQTIEWKSFNQNAVSLKECRVSLSPTVFTYDGTAKKPSVTVTCQGSTLTEGIDYTVTVKNNTNAGKAAVTIESMEDGDYKDDTTAFFSIQKAKPSLSFSKKQLNCDVRNGTQKNTLSCKTDGKLSYQSSNPDVAEVHSNGSVTPKSKGSCTITVTASEGENYKSGSASYQITVTAFKQQKITAADSITKTYGDKSFSLNVKVLGKAPVSYKSSNTKVVTVSSTGKIAIKKAGKAVITVTTSATKTYAKAVKKISISVKPKSIKKVVVKCTKKGKLTYASFDYEKDVVVMDGKKTLKADVDYTIRGGGASGQNGLLTNAHILIDGTGNYSGSAELPVRF